MIDDAQDEMFQQIAKNLLKESLSSQGNARLRVITDSMSPLINVDDFVVVEQTPMQEYQRGDIVVFYRNEELITHRLVRIGGDMWFTKGDRFHSLDDPISVNNLLGKVIEIIRQDNHLDLKSKKWKTINWLKGWFSDIEVRFYRSLRWLRRKM